MALLLARYLIGDFVSGLLRGKSRKWDMVSLQLHFPITIGDFGYPRRGTTHWQERMTMHDAGQTSPSHWQGPVSASWQQLMTQTAPQGAVLAGGTRLRGTAQAAWLAIWLANLQHGPVTLR